MTRYAMVLRTGCIDCDVMGAIMLWQKSCPSIVVVETVGAPQGERILIFSSPQFLQYAYTGFFVKKQRRRV